eukprot:sb/3463556/
MYIVFILDLYKRWASPKKTDPDLVTSSGERVLFTKSGWPLNRGPLNRGPTSWRNQLFDAAPNSVPEHLKIVGPRFSDILGGKGFGHFLVTKSGWSLNRGQIPLVSITGIYPVTKSGIMNTLLFCLILITGPSLLVEGAAVQQPLYEDAAQIRELLRVLQQSIETSETLLNFIDYRASEIEESLEGTVDCHTKEEDEEETEDVGLDVVITGEQPEWKTEEPTQEDIHDKPEWKTEQPTQEDIHDGRVVFESEGATTHGKGVTTPIHDIHDKRVDFEKSDPDLVTSSGERVLVTKSGWSLNRGQIPLVSITGIYPVTKSGIMNTLLFCLILITGPSLLVEGAAVQQPLYEDAAQIRELLKVLQQSIETSETLLNFIDYRASEIEESLEGTVDCHTKEEDEEEKEDEGLDVVVTGEQPKWETEQPTLEDIHDGRVVFETEGATTHLEWATTPILDIHDKIVDFESEGANVMDQGATTMNDDVVTTPEIPVTTPILGGGDVITDGQLETLSTGPGETVQHCFIKGANDFSEMYNHANLLITLLSLIKLVYFKKLLNKKLFF